MKLSNNLLSDEQQTDNGRYFIETHGCQMNEYDSARLGDLLKKHRMSPTDNAEEADLLLLNTCSIRDRAEQKVYHQLGRWQALKKKRPEVIIAVGGCVASQEGSQIGERAPFVDIIFGPQTLHRLPGLVRRSQHRSNSKPVVDISFPEVEKFDHLPPAEVRGPCASVSVMEGCDRYCTFCVVPYTRGKEISRPATDIIEEILSLTERGVREITLLGQNVNAYRGTDQNGQTLDLAELIHTIAEIERIGRIRFTTSHPAAFNDALIEIFGVTEKLADHLHLPVQSGSDRVLAAMKRDYTVLEYKDKIRKLRALRPDISISSDFIVGFPGESEKDFEQTLALMEAVRFDTSFSFIYSPRPGTPAAGLPDNISPEEKKQRLMQLQQLNRSHAQSIGESMMNSRQKILVTGPSKQGKGQLQGRCENNRVVNFSAPGRTELAGQFVTVKITENLPNCLRGELVEAN